MMLIKKPAFEFFVGRSLVSQIRNCLFFGWMPSAPPHEGDLFRYAWSVSLVWEWLPVFCWSHDTWPAPGEICSAAWTGRTATLWRIYWPFYFSFDREDPS